MRPEDWAWSSYAEFMDPRKGGITDTEWPLSMFQSGHNSGSESFREFVLGESEAENGPLPLSDSRPAPGPAKEFPPSRNSRPTIDSILKEIRNASGIDLDALTSASRTRDVCSARRLFAGRAAAAGYRIGEIAETLHITNSGASRLLLRSHAGLDDTRGGTPIVARAGLGPKVNV